MNAILQIVSPLLVGFATCAVAAMPLWRAWRERLRRAEQDAAANLRLVQLWKDAHEYSARLRDHTIDRLARRRAVRAALPRHGRYHPRAMWPRRVSQ